MNEMEEAEEPFKFQNSEVLNNYPNSKMELGSVNLTMPAFWCQPPSQWQITI